MKDKAISVYINSLAGFIDDEIGKETDVNRNCRLQDVKEMLRRAFHINEQIPFEDNDLITVAKSE